jgi:hypothetical protein
MRLRVVLPAALLAGTAFLPAPAHAGPICVGVHVAAASGAPVDVGPVCVPYGGTVTCGTTGVTTVAPTVDVAVTTCLPR